MPMSRQAKEEMVSDLADRLERAKAALIFNYKELVACLLNRTQQMLPDSETLERMGSRILRVKNNINS